MECTKRRFIVSFGTVLFLTAFFLLTTMYELPRNILHGMLPESLDTSHIHATRQGSDKWWFSSKDSSVNIQSKQKSGSPTKPSTLILLTTETGKVSPWRSNSRGWPVGRGNRKTPLFTPFRAPSPVKWKMKQNNVIGETEDRESKHSLYNLTHATLKPKSNLHVNKDDGARYTNVVPSTNVQNALNISTYPYSPGYDMVRVIEPSKRIPDAIIIGVKKGGTRALLQFLCIHPRVKCARKEIHFFDKDKNYGKGLDWYIKQMPAAYSNETVMEKTPAYFVTKSGPERIFKANPLVKLIITFRDPTRRSISDYAQGIDKKQKNIRKGKLRSFESKIYLDVNKTVINIRSPLIYNGLYSQHLRHWLNVFPRDQLHFVSAENLVKKPWEELNHVQKFLNLPIFITKNNFRLNKTKGFFCLTWKKNRKGKLKHDQCLRQSKGRKHPYVSSNTINSLQNFFRPLNQQLYNLTGRNFQWP